MLAELAERLEESNKENSLQIIRSFNDVGEVLLEEQMRTTDVIEQGNVSSDATATNVLDFTRNMEETSGEGDEDIGSNVLDLAREMMQENSEEFVGPPRPSEDPVVLAVNRVTEAIMSLREVFVGMVEAQARDDLQDNENAREEDDDGGEESGGMLRDSFSAGKKDPFGIKKKFMSIKGSIMRRVAGLMKIAGSISGLFGGLFKVVTGVFGRIFGIVTGIVMGIDQAIKNIMNMEGDLLDKVYAGIFGFIEGFSKIITVPLDWLKTAVAWVAEALGFEDFANMLNSFSIAEEFGKLMDKMLGFVLGVKDFVISKGGGLISSGLRMLGFDESAESVDNFVAESTETSAEDRVANMRAKDDGKFGSGYKAAGNAAAEAIEKSRSSSAMTDELVNQTTPLGSGPPQVINNYTSAPTSVNTQNNIDQSGSQNVSPPVAANSSQSDAWAM